jgi:membrane protease YdiL (CAAX protease family)
LISGPLPIVGMIATVVLFWLAIRRRGETLADFGLAPVDSWPRTIAVALGISLAIFVVVAFILNPAINALDLAPRDMSRFGPMEDNVANLIINTALMWITAAFLEELLWRGYLLNRLIGLLGSESPLRWAFVLVTGAVIFALPHFTQGLEGMIKTGAIGLLFGIAFLVVGRRLWPLVLAHGLIDTLDFIGHYFNG